jgi:hypothetical protein
MNAVPADDVKWIRSIHPDLPLVELKNSLSGNADSLLPHGEVLNDLFDVSNGNFCIQDPDCFVTDDRFWDQVSLSEHDFAGGAFWEQVAAHDHLLPQTFFLVFNLEWFRAMAAEYDIDANVIRSLSPQAQRKIESIGYQGGQFPQEFKGYFDTLQAYWVLSLAEGRTFREIPGRGNSIFHIGGTSYLHKTDIELSHWDYWPLSVHYFNLRILELPPGKRFRERYKQLFEMYGSAQQLLDANREFRGGWRCAEIDLIVDYVAT